MDTTMNLIHVSPSELTLVSNIRDAKASDDLVASVREHGLLEPINAYRDDNNDLVVKHGHRRTLAAVAAELDQVPVIVTSAPADDLDGKTDMIAAQWDENQQRQNLTTREQAETIAQLAAFGISPAQISKRLRVDRSTVDAATTMPDTDTLDRYDLTITQAAVVAEFADDDRAVDSLVRAAATGQFEHQAARLRQQRQIAAALAEARAQWEAKGVPVLEGWPAYDSKGEWVDRLVDVETGEKVTIDPDNPGDHLAVRLDADFTTVLTATGEPVDPYEIYEDDEEDRPEDAIIRSQVHEALVVQTRWYCDDLAARGWKTPWSTASQGEPTEEEREQKRAERRDVIAANKAWLAAEQVRRDWLKTFCARKAAPKNSAAFVAATITTSPHLLSADRLRGERETYLTVPDTEAMTTAKATMTSLAMCLIAHEVNTHKGSWRHIDRRTVAYLRFIEDQGYALSPVERRACGDHVDTDEL
ncbi:ParB/RepB/Spo0J family partition protein [Dietzia sp. IN118]|uniref:ParB/RepB/Spo0J family partition protein n=1 Tax=Dietzia sp. IN118 TaxID=3061631 RepID=UPI00293B6176|nr:ParB N-terminal domain-containing protein [Dietzia sp. IN118]MDV3357156.1 ParB N-terminal domain-containing protein [Dietzia sp. IN118]